MLLEFGVQRQIKVTAYGMSPEVEGKLSAFHSLLHPLSPQDPSTCLHKALPSDHPTLKRRNEITPQVIQTAVQRNISGSKGRWSR